MMRWLPRLDVPLPIVQAPMAGVSTPAMAAAVSEAGGLGSIGVGHLPVDEARRQIDAVRALSQRPFNVNVFCNRPPVRDAAREAAWIDRLSPEFAAFDATPPTALREIYTSFVASPAALAMLLDARPAVVSFHFGLPSADAIAALKAAGVVLFATATNVAEARAIEAAGVDAIVAQGYEAGGHRGAFDPDAADEHLGTDELVSLLARSTSLPILAAGGIMDGAGIAAALRLGAAAAQLGTAFIACPESSADAAHRRALVEVGETTMTRAISGRPARSIVNRFTAIDAAGVPDYPVAYDAGKALHAAAKAKGEFGFGAQWAGRGARLSRAMPAGELVTLLAREMQEQ